MLRLALVICCAALAFVAAILTKAEEEDRKRLNP